MEYTSLASLLLLSAYGFFSLMLDIWNLVTRNYDIKPVIFCMATEKSAELAAKRLMCIAQREGCDCFMVFQNEPSQNYAVKTCSINEFINNVESLRS